MSEIEINILFDKPVFPEYNTQINNGVIYYGTYIPIETSNGKKYIYPWIKRGILATASSKSFISDFSKQMEEMKNTKWITQAMIDNGDVKGLIETK